MSRFDVKFSIFILLYKKTGANMKHGFTVDENKCVKCGLCSKDCLTGAIIQENNQIPDMKNPLKCIECQHCLSICPTGAISIMGKNPENSYEIKKINSDDVLNLIQSRRSTRLYKRENVQKEIIEKLKNMLNYTPTGCNNHKLHFSFIENIDVMDDFRSKVNKKIISLIDKKPLQFLVKTINKFSKYKDAFLKGEDILFRGAPHLVVVSAPVNAPCPKEDGIIALSYFELYANSLGIGTLWCGFMEEVLKIMPEFCDYLRIPEGYAPIYVMLFGYSDVQYKRTIQPREYSFTTIEKQENKLDFISKAKRIFWNFAR